MATPDRMDVRLRALGLAEAQGRARALFAEAARRGLFAAGRSEYEVTDRIGDLAREVLGTRTRCPGRIVRSGPHTVVLGEDPARLRLREDLPELFGAAREAFRADPGITGRQLYAELQALAAKSGWTLGGWHAGHLAGEAPAANPMCARADAHISPDNDRPLRRTTTGGWRAHWLLELHLTDLQAAFGGTHQALLDLP
ncbi:aminopeptidase [Streptomyces sp. NPDC001594]|uniref:aminopeptidase n=1 Tax=Streptomyces sp. NPDC001594 TaxID=3364590 RepID=UPI003697ED8E